jgi:uncharacterized membrane protein YvlD (DUF360 family)
LIVLLVEPFEDVLGQDRRPLIVAVFLVYRGSGRSARQPASWLSPGRCSSLPPVIRLIVRTAVLLVANAIGLLVAAAVLDKMQLDASGFILAVIIFTVAVALLQPFLAASMHRRGASAAALGGIALIATFVSLLITDIVSDGLDIEGAGTWLAATVIVWAAGLIAAFILPFLGLKKYLEEKN